MSTAFAPAPLRTVDDHATHAIRRGDFVALVFSGSINALGELPGEPTAATLYKFALPDPRLDAAQDFAAASAAILPRWTETPLRPRNGVCFVLADGEHPAVRALLDRAARPGEHFVVLGEAERTDEPTERLIEFTHALAPATPITLLGYGDQGARIARLLTQRAGVDAARMHVVEHQDEGRAAAEAAGHTLVDDEIAARAAAVVYTPLARHAHLHALFSAAAGRGAAVFSNERRPEHAGAASFQRHGALWLDVPARRVLRVRDDGRLASTLPQLALEAHVVREDRRRLADTVVTHLHGGQRVPLPPPGEAVDITARWSADPFAASTWAGCTGAWVSVRDHPALGVLAARTFCEQRWPEATIAVLPARHPAAMGSTTLERLLLRHLGRCEIAMASQTSPQQAALGVLARVFAADTPIVEIGSALGGSGLLMAAATDEQRPPIISIDPDTASRDVMRFIFEREGQLDRLRQIVATSDDAFTRLGDLRDAAGLVLIDGLHTRRAVTRDFEHYAPLVRPGGVLLFHDACVGWWTVLHTLIERVLPDPRFRLTALIDGLAVFERRDDAGGATACTG